MQFQSSLDEYIQLNYTAADLQPLLDRLKSLLGSPHRRTTLLKSPEKANHVELLQIAQVLNVEPALLLGMGVGKKGMHEIEIAQYGEPATNGHQLPNHDTNYTATTKRKVENTQSAVR